MHSTNFVGEKLERTVSNVFNRKFKIDPRNAETDCENFPFDPARTPIRKPNGNKFYYPMFTDSNYIGTSFRGLIPK